MAHIRPFNASTPKLKDISSPDSFFGTVKKKYPTLRKEGLFKDIEDDSIYVYTIETATSKHTGLICAVPVEEYTSGNIVKHEHTLVAKRQKMLHLTTRRKAIVKPVLLTYPETPNIGANIQSLITDKTPAYQVKFKETGEIHSFFKISDKVQQETLQTLFQQFVPKFYVADGHHRLATAELLKQLKDEKGEPAEKYENIFCALFPTNELEIHDYNRIVNFDNITPMRLMARLSQIFTVTPLDEPRKSNQKHEIILACDNDWFSLIWKSEVLEQYQSEVDRLDVNLLNIEVLQNIFEITDVANDSRVEYIEGVKGVKGVENKVFGNPFTAAFILPPVAWDEFIDITNTGTMLPPKSTWFEPRIKNGLIVYPY